MTICADTNDARGAGAQRILHEIDAAQPHPKQRSDQGQQREQGQRQTGTTCAKPATGEYVLSTDQAVDTGRWVCSQSWSWMLHERLSIFSGSHCAARRRFAPSTERFRLEQEARPHLEPPPARPRTSPVRSWSPESVPPPPA
eukprot:COSAG01_NODE_11437_length_1934_cov_5.403815_1_plen_141_part_10